jgi:hypothetical protein
MPGAAGESARQTSQQGKEKKMKAKQIIALVGVFLVAGLLISANPSTAKSTKTPVEFWEVSCMVDPGFEWIDEYGVLHVRGRVSQATFYEPENFTIVGSDAIISNANLDPATFSGNLFGTWSAVYLPFSDSGTFDGSWTAKLTGGVAALGRAVGRGTGELKGMKMKLTLVSDPADPPPPGLFEAVGFPPCDPSAIVGILRDSGFIHNPGGN